MRNHLLEALVSNYIRLVGLGDSNFVLQKLGSTLITFFSRPGSTWKFPIRHILACTLNGHYVSEESLPEVEQLLTGATGISGDRFRGVLMLASIFAEDLGSHSCSTVDEGRLSTRVAANCLDMLQLLRLSTTVTLAGEKHISQSVPHFRSGGWESAGDEAIRLLVLAIQALPYWVNMIKYATNMDIRILEELALDGIATSAAALERDELTASVLQMLVSLESSAGRILRLALPGFPSLVLTSRKALEIRSSLLRGDFTPDSMLLVDLLESIMGRVDTTKSDYLHDQCYIEIVRVLGQLLRCEGVAVIEDPVCHTVLQRLTEVIEGSTDWDDEYDPAREFLKALAVDACEASLHKIRIPLDQLSSETHNWDIDDRARFRDFRFDVQDFYQSAFALLGNALVEEVVKTIMGRGEPPDWSIFEAGTFCLNSFVDTMSSEADTYDVLISGVLSSPAWTRLLHSSDSVPDRALQTGINFVAENIGYLQRNPENLVPVLNFLFSSLHLKASTSAASRAIYRLCDSHREALYEGLPQFMSSLGSLEGIGEAERHRVYGAVAALIQALPNEEAKVPPLTQLLTPVSHLLGSMDSSSNADKEDVLTACIDIVQTLASIGKGLRSPADFPVDLDAPSADTPDFWITGSGSMVQRELLGIYHATLQRIGSDTDNIFVDGCCDFVKSGFTESHPSPFKFADSMGLYLLQQLINVDNPSIDNTLACATSYLASVEPQSVRESVSGVLYAIIPLQQQILSAFQQTGQLPNSNLPSASLDFLGRLLGKWGQEWFSMEDGQATIAVAVELGLVLMADVDTLPRRSAASFFTAVADTSILETRPKDEAQMRMMHVLETYGPRVLSLLLKLLGGDCARSELESLSEMLRRFVQKRPMLTKAVLREAVKQESGIFSEKSLKATTLERRSRFAAQVESLRGARKTTEIVKDFWIACRGSGFGYTA